MTGISDYSNAEKADDTGTIPVDGAVAVLTMRITVISLSEFYRNQSAFLRRLVSHISNVSG